METRPKRILVVAHNRSLRRTRVQLLQQQGYTVDSAKKDDDALAVLRNHTYALVILGRKSKLSKAGIDELIRQRHPDLLILGIAGTSEEASPHISRTTGPEPQHLFRTVGEMLGRDVVLTQM